jgi:hypothetical protein
MSEIKADVFLGYGDQELGNERSISLEREHGGALHSGWLSLVMLHCQLRAKLPQIQDKHISPVMHIGTEFEQPNDDQNGCAWNTRQHTWEHCHTLGKARLFSSDMHGNVYVDYDLVPRSAARSALTVSSAKGRC